MKASLVVVLMLILCSPAFPKSKEMHSVKGVYPVSCDELWTAVKDTLNNHDNYGLSSVNDLDLRATFVVIGDLFVCTDRVAVVEKKDGCEMRMDIGDIGAENTNWRLFRSRVERSLKKLHEAKASSAPTRSGMTNSAVAPKQP